MACSEVNSLTPPQSPPSNNAPRHQSVMTLDELYAYCGPLDSCGTKCPCEGQQVRILGYVDYANVFSRQKYPKLPYEKFLIRNQSRSKTLEVWVVGNATKSVFEFLNRHQLACPEHPIVIQGTISGFDMPIMGTCRRGIKLEMTGADGIDAGAGETPRSTPCLPD